MAGVAFLQTRPDVDPERIGGIGLGAAGVERITALVEPERWHEHS